MEEIIAVALKSMHHDKTRLERISMNLANALTPGYKREVVAVRPFADMLTRTSASAETAGSNQLTAQSLGVFSAMASATAGSDPLEFATDIRPGTLKSTGQGLDLALTGDGFFEVVTENGPAYTRQGNFRLDERGRLVTAQGYAVMGKGGEIFLNTSRPSIDAAGNITDVARAGSSDQEQTVSIGQIKIVAFKDTKQLQRMGEGLVAAGTDPVHVTDAAIQMRQGFLENANVSTMREMVDLMQTMRHFESMQKAMQGYDDMVGSAIRKLGEA